MGLTSSIAMAVNATLTGTATALGTPSSPATLSRPVELATGTGAGQADKMFSAIRTIAPSANDDLDLNNVLLDAFGVAIVLARVKGLFISAALANSNNVVIGAAGANPWITLLNATGTITLRPGESIGCYSGVADATGHVVTGGTGDILRVANGGAGTSVDYSIVIIGASV